MQSSATHNIEALRTRGVVLCRAKEIYQTSSNTGWILFTLMSAGILLLDWLERTLSFKKISHATISFRKEAKIASEQSFHLLLYRDENTACNHKKTTCIIMAYTLCNQLGSSTQNRSSWNDGTKHLIHLLEKVLYTDKNLENNKNLNTLFPYAMRQLPSHHLWFLSPVHSTSL